MDFKRWENDLTNIINEKFPNTEHNDCIYRLTKDNLYYPPCKGCVLHYFFNLHKLKLTKAIEMLDKYVDFPNGKTLDVGTWISVIGYYFNMKCGMTTDSICIDCPAWVWDNVETHYQSDLSMNNIVDVIGKEKYNNKYDFVLSCEMLSHFPGNIHKLIKQMIDACKVGGIIYISDALGNLGEGLPKDRVIKEKVGKERCCFQMRQFSDNEIINIVRSLSKCELLESNYVSTLGYTGKMQMTIWKKVE